MTDECRNYEKCLILYRLYRQFWSDLNSWSTPWSIHCMHQCWYDVLYLTFNKFTNCFQICIVFFLAQCNLFHFVVAIRAKNFLPVFESKDDILRSEVWLDLSWVKLTEFFFRFDFWVLRLRAESRINHVTLFNCFDWLTGIVEFTRARFLLNFCCLLLLSLSYSNERRIRNLTKQIVATRKSTNS